ncbi:hypothetical protein [Bacillus carboniphilus]|uniref:hypothetical protein n=1 Tax=Bacillus carboniphilus TaxID=86663 RepID=UPI003531E2AF
MASHYLGTGSFNTDSYLVILFPFLFFLGSTFFVKSMIREKNNKQFKGYSWGYHIGLVIILLIFVPSYLVVIPFIPSVFRAVFLYGKKLSVIQIGVSEIFNSVFVLITLIMVL